AVMRELSIRDAKKPKPPAAKGAGKAAVTGDEENRINPLDRHAAERKKVKAQADEIAREFSVNARVAGEMRGALGTGAVPVVVDHLSGKAGAPQPSDIDFQAYDAWLLLGALNISPMEA